MAAATATAPQQWQSTTAHMVAGQKRSAPTCAASASSSSRQQYSSHAESYDRFYGHRDISEMCESVISALFACPLDSSSSSVGAPNPSVRATPRLAEFIAYALHRTRLPSEITYQALFLLRRLKSRFPAARGSSGHRLFISALMLASKSSCDDTYSNKSWTIVSQGLFSLREVNQMERELFGYLGYKVNVEVEELDAFTSLLQAGDVLSVTDMSMATSPMISDDEVMPAAAVDDTHPATTKSASFSHVEHISAAAAVASAVAASAMGRQQHRKQAASMSTMTYTATGAVSPATVPAGYAVSNNHLSSAYPSSHSHLSPSMASLSSSRGSISSSVGGYSMAPSPTDMSHSESSASSRTSPDTPSSDFDASPWTDNGKFSDEPAGTYDDQYMLYRQRDQREKQHQQFFAHHQAMFGASYHH